MREYVKPMMDSEVFVANEYVSACYSGTCNISGPVYMDSNNNGKYDESIDSYKYTNTACDHTFTMTGASSPEPKSNAFVVEREWVWDRPFVGHWETSATPVYNFDNVHVSTMDSIKKHERPNHS